MAGAQDVFRMSKMVVSSCICKMLFKGESFPTSSPPATESDFDGSAGSVLLRKLSSRVSVQSDMNGR